MTRKRQEWSRAGTRWTHELVGYALDRFHSTHMRVPTQAEVRAGDDQLPSYSTMRRLYGNLGSMLHHHGYRPRAVGGQPGRGLYVTQRDGRGRFLPNVRPR